jgi:hypothetical protein
MTRIIEVVLTSATIRKVISATQPGRGIRKIIDLFHELHDLVDKADKHVVTQRLSPAERKKFDIGNFVGMTEEDIDEEHQEYVTLHSKCHHRHCDST